MRFFLALALACVPAVAAASEADFSIKLLHPYNGLSQCQVSFNANVPARSKVDAVMAASMELCRQVDQKNDLQVMAFHHDDALSGGQSTFAYLVFHRKLRCVQKVTEAQMADPHLKDAC